MASWWDTVFGGGAQEDAAAKNATALTGYQNTGLDALKTGYGTATGATNQAIGAYQPLVNLGTQYSQAGSLLGGALGAGGPAGTAAAQAAFAAAPGTTGAITAGLDAIDRNRATHGMLDSGNTDQDAQTFGQNLQNTQYNNWLQNLQSMAGMGLNATQAGASGQAAGYGTLANLGTQFGQDQTSLAGNVASGTMADNNMVAAGQAAGAKNLLGAGLSLATLAMGGVGGAAGGAGGFSNSLMGQGLTGMGNLIKNNVGTVNAPGLFGGGSPSGY